MCSTTGDIIWWYSSSIRTVSQPRSSSQVSAHVQDSRSSSDTRIAELFVSRIWECYLHILNIYLFLPWSKYFSSSLLHFSKNLNCTKAVLYCTSFDLVVRSKTVSAAGACQSANTKNHQRELDVMVQWSPMSQSRLVVTTYWYNYRDIVTLL